MPGNKLSPEDRLDSVYRAVALVFLAIGALHTAAAVQQVVTHGTGFFHAASLFRQSMLVVTLLLCVLAIWRSVSFTRNCVGCSLMVKDGFVFHSIQKSGLRAGFLTFIALVFMQEFADGSTLPVKFFLNMGLAIITLTFSISYLISSYADAGHD